MANSRVGVRELRQNLSVYLRRVEAGETLEVTHHGRVVAELAPLPDSERIWSELEDAGFKVRRATRRIEDLPPPIKPPPGAMSSQEALAEQRRERF